MGEANIGSRGGARRIVHGTYKGDGTYPKRLTLGFRPSFLAVYAVNSRDDNMTLLYPVQNARINANGASADITWYDDGVQWLAYKADLVGFSLNRVGYEYAYLAIE